MPLCKALALVLAATEGEDLSKAFDAPHFLSAQPINQDQSAIDSPFASGNTVSCASWPCGVLM